MVADIFDFWGQLSPEDTVHPADRKILARVDHGFDLGCLPCSFAGPLRTAPVVLLYLSPGFSSEDHLEAVSDAGQERYARTRRGYEPLSGPGEHKSAHRWWASRTSAFGDWDSVRTKIAVLNIGGYHSRTFEDPALLAALPSSRVSLEWAQSILFEQAEAGERIVVCMRATRFWGLTQGRKYGQALYAPRITRSGHMLHADEFRGEVVASVRGMLARTT